MDIGCSADKAKEPCEISGKWPLATSLIGHGVAGVDLGVPLEISFEVAKAISI